MSETTVRAAIKATMEGVTGIGRVHDWIRYSRSQATFLNLMKTEAGIYNGWMFGRESVSEVGYDVFNSTTRGHTYRIIGIYGLDDEEETEKDFQSLIDNIITALEADETLGGLCINCDRVSVENISVEEFANTLYHYTEMRFTAYERI